MRENRIRDIEYSKRFLKSLKKLPIKIINKAQEKEKIFRENPFNPILKTHKLMGTKKRSLGILDKLYLPYKISLS
jgi:mRNA-degrading endonuclease RelE of RelBE toxin-antitoxin system